MKRKKLNLPQLNKYSALKLVLFVAVIILIEIAAGVFIFNQFSSRTYRQEYEAYESKSGILSNKIYAAHASDIADIESDAQVLEQIKEQCVIDGQFDYYIVFSETQGGRIIDGGGLELNGNIGSYGLNYNQTSTFKFGGKTFVFAPSEIGESSYRVAGIADFTERQAIIDNLRGNTVAA
ncbi:MAG: hypothetical protein K2L72_06050, partial [Clostridia bacterium]|nr:hypothetical protein [Clostridia bacterium]